MFNPLFSLAFLRKRPGVYVSYANVVLLYFSLFFYLSSEPESKCFVVLICFVFGRKTGKKKRDRSCVFFYENSTSFFPLLRQSVELRKEKKKQLSYALSTFSFIIKHTYIDIYQFSPSMSFSQNPYTKTRFSERSVNI